MESKEKDAKNFTWIAKNRMSCLNINRDAKWYEMTKMNNFMFHRRYCVEYMDKYFEDVLSKYFDVIKNPLGFPNNQTTLEEQIIVKLIDPDIALYNKVVKMMTLHHDKKMLFTDHELLVLKDYLMICPYVIVDILLNEGHVDMRSYEDVRKDILDYFVKSENPESDIFKMAMHLIISARDKDDDQNFIDISQRNPFLKEQNFDRKNWLSFSQQIKDIIEPKKELSSDEYLREYMHMHHERLLAKLIKQAAFEEIYPKSVSIISGLDFRYYK